MQTVLRTTCSSCTGHICAREADRRTGQLQQQTRAQACASARTSAAGRALLKAQRRCSTVVCGSGKEDTEQVQQVQAEVLPDDDDELLIEQQLRRRRKKASGGPKVVAPQVQQAYGGGPQTPEGQTETAILQFLALFFLVIMVEGIFIAASGFLPEAADQFAQDVVYPAFSPTLAVFLVCSTAYGLWKSKSGTS